MPFDLAGARQAGYSDDEIAGFLAQQSGFDLGGATKAGYSSEEVIEFLSGTARPARNQDAGVDYGEAATSMMGATPAPPPQPKGRGVAGELGQLRDEFFTGVDQAIAGGKTLNAAAQANQLRIAQDKLQALEAKGQGSGAEAQGLRKTIAVYEKRLPAMVGSAAEAQVDAQRGAAMTTRPAVAKVNAAKTWGEAWDAFKEAPYDVIAGVTAQSLPTMLPALAAGVVAGPGAGAAAMGLSSGATEAGSSLADYAREAGVDVTDQKALQAFFSDRQQLAAAMEYAGKRAGIIGALDAASGGIAGKTIAPKVIAKPLARQAVNVPAQMGVQAAAGAGGEAGAQLATKGEIDQPGQVLMEAVGELGGAPAEVLAFSREARQAVTASAPAPAAAPNPIEAIRTAPTVDAAIVAARDAVASPAQAVDNIARILGQESTDAGQPAAVPPVPAESGGAGGADAAAGVGLGVGPGGARVPAVEPGGAAGGAAAGPVPLGAAGPAAVEGQPAAAAPMQATDAVSAGMPPFSSTMSPSGTLTVLGDPTAVRKLLKDNGVTQLLQAKNGLVVGKSQAAQAQQVLADFTQGTAPTAAPSAPQVVAAAPEAVPTAAPAPAAAAVPAVQEMANSVAKPAPSSQTAAAPSVAPPAQSGEAAVAAARGSVDESAQRRSDEPMPSGLTLDQARAAIRRMRGARVADVQAQVNAMAKGWKNGPKITVVQTVDDLPGDNPPDARGLYEGGRVWVVAGAHRNDASLKTSVARTVAHEVVAHYGLRNMLGRDGWNRLMANIQLGVKSGNRELRRIQQFVRDTYVAEDGRFALNEAQEADEIAAKAVEEAIDEKGNFRPGFGFLKSVWARVAQFLRELGIRVPFSNRELQGMLVLAMQGLQAGQRTEGGGQMAVAAARATSSKVGDKIANDEAETISARAAAAPDAERDTGTAEGRSRGQQQAQGDDQEGVDGFDGSAQARAFHGTPHQVDRFKTENIGSGEGAQSFGWGLYFTDRKEIAEHYRKGVSESQFINLMRETYSEFDSPNDAVDQLMEDDSLSDGQKELLLALQADDWLGFDFPHQALRAALREPENFEVSPRTQKALDGLGKVYQVEIPDDGEYLLWDKPISEQPPAVAQALAKVTFPFEGWTGHRYKMGGYIEPVGDKFRARGPNDLGTFNTIDEAKAAVEYWLGKPRNPPTTGAKFYERLEDRLGSDEAASKHLRALGIRGVKYLDGSSRRKGDGTYNYVIFDDADVQIVGDAFDSAQQARGGTANPQQQAQPAPAATSPKLSPWRDATGRLQFAPGAWLYDKLGDLAGPMLSKLQLKAASPELRRALREMKVQVAKAQETAAAVAGEAMKLTEDERAMVSDLIEQELRAGVTPPAHAVRLAAMINTSMGAQTDELVRLGMLSKDSADMWRDKYLPRFYRNKLGKQVGDAWADAVNRLFGRTRAMVGIKGKHLRGRGLFENVPVDQIADWEAQGWQVRDPEYEDFLANPGNYQTDWTADNRDVQMWRDFTRAERDAMGEIRDAGFRFVMGYMQTQRDIALGRMFEQLAQDAKMSSRRETQEFSVQVPDGTVPGTGAKRYGKLAGRWVSKDTMAHLSQIEEAQSDAWRMYRKALALWKEGKTALNPVSHVNNMLSNVTMAHFAGVGYMRADKYIAAARDFATSAAGVKEAKDAGLFLGTLSDAELMNVLPEDLKSLVKQQDSAATKIGRSAFNVMTFWLRRPMGWAYQAEDTFFRYLIYKDARDRGMQPQDAVDYAQRFIFTYDDLPKGARLIRDFGIPFFSYTYKAVPALLHTALTHPLRFAAPAAVLWAANAAAYAIAAGDDDDSWDEKLRKYLTDPEFRARAREKEKLEREHLPPWMKGTTALGTPKAIRLGTDELTKLPVFIDTARIVPGGDLFDVSPNAGGIPLPQPITPSHPIFTTAVAMLGNKDLWTGKDLIDMNDTRGEAAEKRSGWLWRQVTPAITLGNYHWERGLQALAQASGGEVKWLPQVISERYTGIGRDGNPVQPGYAAMQTFGIKARPIDLEMSESIERSTKDKMIRDINAEINKLQKLNAKGAISDSVMEKERSRAEEKKDRLRQGLTVDGDTKD